MVEDEEYLTFDHAPSTPGFDTALTTSRDRTVIVPSHIFSTRQSLMFLWYQVNVSLHVAHNMLCTSTYVPKPLSSIYP